MHNGGGLWQPPTGAVAAATVPASWEGLQQHLDIVCAAALPLPSVACSAGLTAAFQALDLLRGLGGLGEAELLVRAGTPPKLLNSPVAVGPSRRGAALPNE